MTALRMRARDFLTDDQLADVRQRVTWKGVALIAHAWALIIGAIALVAWWPNPITYHSRRRHHRLAPARACDPDA